MRSINSRFTYLLSRPGAYFVDVCCVCIQRLIGWLTAVYMVERLDVGR